MDEKILEALVCTIREFVVSKYPDYTDVGITLHSDGYVNISVEKWKKQDGDIASWPRKQLFSRSKISGEWERETSEWLNDYYKKIGILWED